MNNKGLPVEFKAAAAAFAISGATFTFADVTTATTLAIIFIAHFGAGAFGYSAGARVNAAVAGISAADRIDNIKEAKRWGRASLAASVLSIIITGTSLYNSVNNDNDSIELTAEANKSPLVKEEYAALTMA